MSRERKDAGPQAELDEQPQPRQTRAARMRASNMVQNTTESDDNSSTASAPSSLPAHTPPLSSSTQQNSDSNSSEDLAGSSAEEIDDAESSDYQQSSEEPSDSESGDEDYQPDDMISRNRNRMRYGPNHNAGRPVTEAIRQKTSNQNAFGHASQNTASPSNASQNTASPSNGSQNSASQLVVSEDENQTDEEEIILPRDHPQEERCLPYRTTSRMPKRQIISWDANLYSHSLLSLIWILEVRGVPVPWQEVAAIVNPGATGEAFKQAMVKLRARRVEDGQSVPPARPGNTHPHHVCQMELEEFMRNAGVPTGPLVATNDLQDLQTDEDSSIAEHRATAPVVEARSVAGPSAGAEQANSEVGVQRLNGNSSRRTTQQFQATQQFQRVTQSEPRDTRQVDPSLADPSLAIIGSRSFTSAHQESRAAPTGSPRRSLIFVADIGAQKALLNFNKKEQKLIFDITHNLTNGHFDQPPPNPVFFLDEITPLSHAYDNILLPFHSEAFDLEYEMAQQKRKRSGASSSPKMSGVVATIARDNHSNQKKAKRGTDANSPSYWLGDGLGGSKKRKHDDADIDDLSPGTAAEWMVNPEHAGPAGDSNDLSPGTAAEWMVNPGNAGPVGENFPIDYSTMAERYPTWQFPYPMPPTHHAHPSAHHDPNPALSAPPSLHPRGSMGGSLTDPADMLNNNQQPLLMENTTRNMYMGQNMGMGMDSTSMPSVGTNYQGFNFSKGFSGLSGPHAGEFDPGLDDPFMGEGSGTLDYGLGGPSMGTSSHDPNYGFGGPSTGTSSHDPNYGLGGVTSDKDKDLLCSTYQWQSPGRSIFAPSQAERRLAGLPPLPRNPGDSDYGQDSEIQKALDVEYLRHQGRGMLNDESIEPEPFDPNAFTNEAFACMGTPPLPEPEDDGL